MAALTASEASIYGRFGYGVATSEQSIKVDTTSRFKLNHTPVGSVEVADPEVLLDLAPVVFDRLHRTTPGSIDRQEFYRRFASGSIGRDGGEDPKPSRWRCTTGRTGKWTATSRTSSEAGTSTPYTMEVVDLVAATRAAYLELWQYLGAIDLVERVSWREAPVDDPLPWALEDARCVEASDARDMLWLRILDVKDSLEARHYPADGRLVLHVSDSLGLADGRFALDVNGGAAVVTDGDGHPADLELDVAALSSIYLGGIHPVTLTAVRPDPRAHAGRSVPRRPHVRRRTPGALPHALLAPGSGAPCPERRAAPAAHSPAAHPRALTGVGRKRLD